MQINFEGKEYTFDLDDMTVDQARVIKVTTGLSLMGLQSGLSDGDIDAITAIYWLMLVQSGEKPGDIKKLNFKIVPFMNAISEAAAADKAANADDAGPNLAGE